MAAVHEKVGMPLDEFIVQTNETIFEIVNGRRIPRLPTVAGHSETLNNFLRVLLFYPDMDQIGIVFAAGTYVLLDRDNVNWVEASRTPDLLFISAVRWSAYKKGCPHWGDVPLLIVPDFVIEVISPADIFTKVNEKVDAYLGDGVHLIVLVDPQSRKTFVYAPDREQPLFLGGDAVLDLSAVIPGLQIALSKLFE